MTGKFPCVKVFLYLMLKIIWFLFARVSMPHTIEAMHAQAFDNQKPPGDVWNRFCIQVNRFLLRVKKLSGRCGLVFDTVEWEASPNLDPEFV
jgi:hypothetical protein